jgi:hypothetical protein
VYDLALDQQATVIGLVRARRDPGGALWANSAMSVHDRLILANMAAGKNAQPVADPVLEEFMREAGLGGR